MASIIIESIRPEKLHNQIFSKCRLYEIETLNSYEIETNDFD
jgi:hypothetical protein